MKNTYLIVETPELLIFALDVEVLSKIVNNNKLHYNNLLTFKIFNEELSKNWGLHFDNEICLDIRKAVADRLPESYRRVRYRTISKLLHQDQPTLTLLANIEMFKAALEILDI